MKLSVKFLLVIVFIIVALSATLESISFSVFGKAINSLNKKLFNEKLENLLLLAREQDELIFEGVYDDEKNAVLRVIDKVRIIYRKEKNEPAYPFIVDLSGRIVIHPEAAQDQQIFNLDVLEHIRETKEGEIEYLYHNKRYWCVFKTFEPWNWVFCMATSLDNKNKEVVSFIKIGLLISAAVIVFGVLIIYFFSRNYANSIYMVVQRLQAIARGEVNGLKQNGLRDSKDELGVLVRTVAKLADDLKKSTVSIDVLRQEEERFRIAAESTSDLIYDWDIQSGKLNWFGDIDGKLGYAKGEFPRTIGARGNTIHPDDRNYVNEALDKHLKERKPFLLEYRILHKDGSVLYCRDCGSAIWDKNGQAYRMYGACSDITQRRLAEDELKENMRQLEAFNKIAVDRELKMVELKEKIKKLEEEIAKGK